MSRTVNGEFLFAESDREFLRQQIWLVAEYCGVQVLTYAVLSNHFHLLVRVPKAEPISDLELLRRYQLLYPRATRFQMARLEVVKALLASDGDEAVRWRSRQLKLMGDLSQYLKLLKQRFSIGFNKRHKRYGTLWSERFKSVLLEPGTALKTVAAYIDLNCVRAGLAEDPKDYRFCGYAEAVAGRTNARAGIEFIYGESWQVCAPIYRLHLVGSGSDLRAPKGKIADDILQQSLKEKGELNWTVLLRCRLRFISDSGILGSSAFIVEMAKRCQQTLRRKPAFVRPIPQGNFFHALKWPRATSAI